MADIEKVARGAKQVTKRVKSSDAMNKPVGLAMAGAALAALPFAVQKLTGAGPNLAEKAEEVAGGAKEKVKSEIAGHGQGRHARLAERADRRQSLEEGLRRR